MADSLPPTGTNAILGLVGFLAGVPAVAPASAGRSNRDFGPEGKTARRRSTDAERWRTAFARLEQTRYSALLAFWAGVPAVAPASAGRSNRDFGPEGKT